MSSDIDFPVHEELDVLNGMTVSKNDDWWKAVVVCEGYSSPNINIYLWQKRDGEWKRKQKMSIRSASEWNEISEAVSSFSEEYLED